MEQEGCSGAEFGAEPESQQLRGTRRRAFGTQPRAGCPCIPTGHDADRLLRKTSCHRLLHGCLDVLLLQPRIAETAFFIGQIEGPHGFGVGKNPAAAHMVERTSPCDSGGQQCQAERARIVQGQVVSAGNRLRPRFAIEAGREALAHRADPSTGPQLRLQHGDTVALVLQFVRGAQAGQSRAQYDDTLRGPAPFQAGHLRRCRRGRNPSEEFTAGLHLHDAIPRVGARKLGEATQDLFEALKFFHSDSELAQNFMEQRRTDFATTVARNGDTSPVQVYPSFVTSRLALQPKSQPCGCPAEFFRSCARHGRFRWCPWAETYPDHDTQPQSS